MRACLVEATCGARQCPSMRWRSRSGLVPSPAFTWHWTGSCSARRTRRFTTTCRGVGRPGHRSGGSPADCDRTSASLARASLHRRSSSWHSREFPDVVEIVVEIPRGSRNKYEFDEEAERLPARPRAVLGGLLQLRLRVHRGHPGRRRRPHRRPPDHRRAHVHRLPRLGPPDRRPRDARREGFDFKTLCVAIGDPHQQHIERLDQVRPHRLVEIEHFFNTYKLLEEKAVDVVGLARPGPGARGARGGPRPLPGRDGWLSRTVRLFVAVPAAAASRSPTSRRWSRGSGPGRSAGCRAGSTSRTST